MDRQYGQNLRNRPPAGPRPPVTTLPRTPAPVGFQKPPPSQAIPGIQQNLQQQVGNIPLPVDTSALIAQQTELQRQIAALYAQAEQNQARGYGTQLGLQADLAALLGLDPTQATDEQMLAALEQQRQGQLNNNRANRAIWAYGFQRNG